MLGVEQQVATVVKSLTRLQPDVDLAAGIVEANRLRFLDEIGVEVLGAHELEDRALDVRVGQDGLTADASAVDVHRLDLPVFVDFDLLDEGADADVDAVAFQLGPASS